MLIEVLYMPGCPNHLPAVRRIEQILRSEEVDAPVRKTPVTDGVMARILRFPGSPTVRINGLDAEPSGERPVGLACRLYASGQGLPSEETLQRAISSARSRERGL
jgi:hypothetical protein